MQLQCLQEWLWLEELESCAIFSGKSSRPIRLVAFMWIFLYLCMLYQETKGFHFHPYGEKCTQNTKFLPTQCGSVQPSGLLILKVSVVFTAITSICTIGWVGGYAVPIFARMVMAEKDFKRGPFYLGKSSRPVCLVAFLWICYTCSVFLLPTYYPITCSTFNYAPVALSVGLGLILLWWVLDARKWFKGPVRNIETDHSGKV